MMRIKEAIQRKKLIHEMNEEFLAEDFFATGGICPIQHSPLPDVKNFSGKEIVSTSDDNQMSNFVQYMSAKLSDAQKRALKVTWKRLSEAPKTSGRGTIHIMEKVLNKMCASESAVPSIFYKSAFLSCIEDRKCGRRLQGPSIATIRDHAHILVEFVDTILSALFEGSTPKPGFDPESIGAAHSKLTPLGFDRKFWLVLGECFAEVMFNQECIRAYPHAPSAWSLLAVAMTDRMYAAGKSVTSQTSLYSEHAVTCEKGPPKPPRGFFIDRMNHLDCTTEPSSPQDGVYYTAREDFDYTTTRNPTKSCTNTVTKQKSEGSLQHAVIRPTVSDNFQSTVSTVTWTKTPSHIRYPRVKIPRVVMRSRSEARLLESPNGRATFV